VSLLILLGMAWVTIGERPNALGVAGVLLSALGVYLLQHPACPPCRRGRRSSCS